MSTFVTLNDIKPFIAKSIYNALYQDFSTGVTYFDKIEPEVKSLIESVSGLDLDTPPDWIKYPSALIFSKIAKRLLTEIDPVFNQTIEKDYEAALEMIRAKASQDITPPDNSSSFNGSIGDIYEW